MNLSKREYITNVNFQFREESLNYFFSTLFGYLLRYIYFLITKEDKEIASNINVKMNNDKRIQEVQQRMTVIAVSI